jgi:hypothetical protein
MDAGYSANLDFARSCVLRVEELGPDVTLQRAQSNILTRRRKSSRHSTPPSMFANHLVTIAPHAAVSPTDRSSSSSKSRSSSTSRSSSKKQRAKSEDTSSNSEKDTSDIRIAPRQSS